MKKSARTERPWTRLDPEMVRWVVPWVRERLTALEKQEIESWYAWQYGREGHVTPYGSLVTYASNQKRGVRWEWPPVARRASYGWRGRLVAAWLMVWRDRKVRQRFFRRWTWAAIHAVARGQRPFRKKDWDAVVRDVGWCWARSMARQQYVRKKKKVWRVGLTNPSWMTLAPHVKMAPARSRQMREPDVPKGPSQWNER